jgi:hypothetical protein
VRAGDGTVGWPTVSCSQPETPRLLTSCLPPLPPAPCHYTSDAGFSGVEFAGYANDQTNLADSRTDQSAQAIAYPYNILSPVNPLTCTQVCSGCAVCVAARLSGHGMQPSAVALGRSYRPEGLRSLASTLATTTHLHAPAQLAQLTRRPCWAH